MIKNYKRWCKRCSKLFTTERRRATICRDCSKRSYY